MSLETSRRDDETLKSMQQTIHKNQRRPIALPSFVVPLQGELLCP